MYKLDLTYYAIKIISKREILIYELNYLYPTVVLLLSFSGNRRFVLLFSFIAENKRIKSLHFIFKRPFNCRDLSTFNFSPLQVMFN